jgi:D-serine deaminase-like pyridoxal phosphate-dependent protein
MVEIANLLQKEGIPVEHLSVGSSSTIRSISKFMREGKFREITEVHPGNFVIGDISYMKEGGNTREMCAGTVLTTVISTSHPEKAIIDAGFKTFGADYLIGASRESDYWWEGWPTFGSVQGRPDLRCGFLSAEVGSIYYMDRNEKLELGERIEIVPNNVTLVISLHDQIYGVRQGKVEKVIAVTGHDRGI